MPLGDEGTAHGMSYMVFHWQCDVAPRASYTDSGSSRYLICTIPASCYIFDGDVNLTLQEAAKHITTSLSGNISVPLGLQPASW